MVYCIAGKNDIAVNILEYLLINKKVPKDNILVCCDKNETGKNSWQRSLRFAARKLNVREVSLEDIYSIPDLIFLSLEFDKIIKPELFTSKKLFNIHFSLLPAYKGMHTSVLPILNNEKYVGVTFHYINRGIDTGNIIAQKKIRLNFEDTSRDVYLRNMEYGTILVKEIIDKYEYFNCESFPQNPYSSSYNSINSIDYKNIRIDLNQTALSIHNQIRAFNFREYQLPKVNGQKISFCKITGNQSTEKPGSIIWQDSDCFMLSTIDYDIVLYLDKFQNICEACQEGDIQKLKKIPGLHHYINEKDSHGWTPLMIATYNGFYDVAMLLIENGSDIYAKNNNGTNLLMYAKDCFVKTGDCRLFDFFYEKGLPLDMVDYNYKSLRDYCIEQNLRQIGNISIFDSAIVKK